MAAYPEHADEVRALLTPRGEDMVNKTAEQCVPETIFNFMFRHLGPYLNRDIDDIVNSSRSRPCSPSSGSARCARTPRC
jgi:triacylglycerol lipase